MMNYIRIISTVISGMAGFVLLSSCVKDQQYTDLQKSGEEIDITVSVTVPGTFLPGSRALSPDDENEIQTIDLLVFEKDGKYLRTAYGRDITTEGGDMSKKTFNVALAVGEYDIIVLANSRDEAVFTVPPASRDEAAALLALSVNGKWNALAGSSGYRPIPMWGEMKGAKIDENNTTLTNLRLFRAVAKTDIIIGGTASGSFTLESVRLYNYMNAGQLIPDSGNRDALTGKVTAASVPARASRVKGPLTWDNGSIEPGGLSCKDEIYMFEAVAGSRSGYLDNTCLVIGGKWNGTTYYYRVDYISKGTGSFLDIIRNRRYDITVEKITGPGFTDPEDAFKSLPFNIESSIETWDDDDTEEVWFDGQYYYAVSPGFAQHNITASSGNRIKISTDYPEWSYKVSDRQEPDNPLAGPVSWLSVDSHTAGNKYEGNGTPRYLEYSLLQGGLQRSAYVHVTAGRKTMTVTVTQKDPSIESINVQPTGLIPARGETRTVVAAGDFENTKVRARDLTSSSFVREGTIPKGLSGSADLLIPEFWFGGTVSQPYNRDVLFEYYNQDIAGWLPITMETQNSYWLEISSNLGQTIPEGGSQYTVYVKGEFPAVVLRSAVGGTEILSLGATIPAAVTPSNTVQGSVSVPPNISGKLRNVHLQYSVNNGATWTTINVGAQDSKLDNFVLPSTGRIVAKQDLPTMGWAQAMGIPTIYNNRYFYSSSDGPGNIENTGYVPTEYTGCHGYSENAYDYGLWRVPTIEELYDMHKYRDEIGGWPYLYGRYWSARETAVNHSYNVGLSGDYPVLSSVAYKSEPSMHIRCVRSVD